MKNALEVGEEHFNFLPPVSAAFIARRFCDGPGYVAAVLV
jgi:hypothetical protein